MLRKVSLIYLSIVIRQSSGFVTPISTARSLTTRSTSRLRAMDPTNPEFVLGVLGDLHLNPKEMKDHEEARDTIIHHIENESFLHETSNVHLVSLGDLGAYGSAGTTTCFEHAKEYLDGYSIPYSVLAGNHDLEGLDEFTTDEENLSAFCASFGMDTPQFCKEVARKTLLIGLSTTHFRSAPFSSHEVYIDQKQMIWFEETLASHPAADGWSIIVFTHAPPIGSGLRVVQGVHINNACAWLNHSAPPSERRAFVKACEKHKNIKAWFSGHFHLSHDYEDSIRQGPGGCVFVQCGVIGSTSSRDGRRQTRIVHGTAEGLSVYTVSHHQGGEELRLDCSVTYEGGQVVTHHGHEDYDHAKWFSAYTPLPADGCYVNSRDGLIAAKPHQLGTVCWWHMFDGRVLGVHDGMVVEYDSECLSPLGIVCDRDQLQGREVAVVDGGRALLLLEWRIGREGPEHEVIHPDADGSYWRKRQRNKAIRIAEKGREKLAKEWVQQRFATVEASTRLE